MLPFDQIAANLDHFAKRDAAREHESKTAEATKLRAKGRSIRETTKAIDLARLTIQRLIKSSPHANGPDSLRQEIPPLGTFKGQYRQSRYLPNTTRHWTMKVFRVDSEMPVLSNEPCDPRLIVAEKHRILS